MHRAFRFLVLLPLLFSSSQAFLEPNFVGGLGTGGARDMLESCDPVSKVLKPGARRLVREGDTIGLVVGNPDRSIGAGASPWMDSLVAGLTSRLQSGLSRSTTVFDAVVRSGPHDGLDLDLSASIGGFDNPGYRPVAPREYTKRIFLGRPDVSPGWKAVLVVESRLVQRKYATRDSGGVIDVLVSWGMWDPKSSGWVAWGLAPLRNGRDDVHPIAVSEGLDRLGSEVLESLPAPGDVGRELRKAKYGGILVGARLRFGTHMSGGISDLVKTSVSDATVDEWGVDLSVGYFPSNWGVSLVIPVTGTLSAEWKSVDGFHTSTVDLFDRSGPGIEVEGFMPNRWGAVAGSLNAGLLWLQGSSDILKTGSDGSGLFVRPMIGYYAPCALGFVQTDVGYEWQRFSFTGNPRPFKAGILLFDIRIGFRFGHD